MLVYTVRIVRGSFRLLLGAAIAFLLSLALAPHVLPLVGIELYVVRGASMTPAIPVGSAVLVHVGDVDRVHPGDVITFRGTNGTVVTHRVTGIDPNDPGAFQTKGDASEAADPFTVDSESVIGTVQMHVPIAGAMLLQLGTAVGMGASAGLCGGLAVAAWVMDHVLATVKRAQPRQLRAPEAA